MRCDASDKAVLATSNILEFLGNNAVNIAERPRAMYDSRHSCTRALLVICPTETPWQDCDDYCINFHPPILAVTFTPFHPLLLSHC